jgi:hypothetical protein
MPPDYPGETGPAGFLFPWSSAFPEATLLRPLNSPDHEMVLFSLQQHSYSCYKGKKIRKEKKKSRKELAGWANSMWLSDSVAQRAS